MSASAPRLERLSDREFHWLRAEIERHAGISLGENKRELVHNRIARRLRELGMAEFGAYCEYLADVPGEVEYFVNAITTNLTRFFREPHHFDDLADRVLAPLVRAPRNTRIRLWSAGCSTGEEAYSIAVTVTRALPDWSHRDIKILATDIDSAVLDTARAGRYGRASLEAVDERVRHDGFDTEPDGNFRVKSPLRDLVVFRRLNLNHSPWPMRRQFNAIFCRNVLIYFAAPRQRGIVARYADYLPPGGTLYLGHSEALSAFGSGFSLRGSSIYERAG